MKKLIFLSLILALLSCSTAIKFESSSNSNIIPIQYKNINGIVLNKDYDLIFLTGNEVIRFDPTKEDLLKAEIILKDNIKERNKSQMMNQGDDCPIIHRNLNKYFRQYFGVINNKGEKIIHINMLWDRSSMRERIWGSAYDRDKYYKEYTIILDGCSYYWYVTINLATEKIESLWVNGLA